MENKSLFPILHLLLFLPLFVQSITPALNDDVLGLIVFKADIHDPYGKLASWNEDDASPCSWVGVTCSPKSGRVVEVVLEGFSLSGRLSRGLIQLQCLRKLSLGRNNFTGGLIEGLVGLNNLRFLDLGNNGLSGELDDGLFAQCGSLRSISLSDNRFTGPIPKSLGSCSWLTYANLSNNRFSGNLNSEIWSLHGLRTLDVSNNELEGVIPGGIPGLYNLRVINFSKNRLSGQIPDDIGGCSLLKWIDLSENSLSGFVPGTLSNLSFCVHVNLKDNRFQGQVPEWIGRMRALEVLDLSANNFSGAMPIAVGNLKSLKVLNLSMNSLEENLPESMIGCASLEALDLRHNLLQGGLPHWIFHIGLQEVLLSQNRLGGSMNTSFSASALASWQSLRVLDVSGNSLFGGIPLSIGNFSSLQVLNLSRNSLSGPVPDNVGKLKALEVLDLSKNSLNGVIPAGIGGAASLRELVLGNNLIVGDIPTSIQYCSSLQILVLSSNRLSGTIPSDISKLTDLEFVDLSSNNFTGSLPKQLANLPHLASFNISHNNLEGELPAGGFFNTISPSSVEDNPSLCGSVVNRSCSTVLPKPIVLNPNSTSDVITGSLPSYIYHKRIILSISSLVAIGAAAAIVIGVIAISLLNFRARASSAHSAAALALSNGNDYSCSPSTDANSGKLVMFSGEPDFSTGAQALLSKDCELGRGGFGTVYRTVLGDGVPVAIKKLTVSSLVKSQDEFEREVKRLGRIRHPNLVSLQGYYWTQSLQLLIYEFASGGSLYKHLHDASDDNLLTWDQRFRIILGMAKGLTHLHQANIIHYNLKSSNILIDGSGKPKVGDFGLAKLLPMLDRYVLSSKIQSALGYMAPEFACRTVKINEKCDVYGFGVLVLETVTGKSPVEYMEDDVVVLSDMVRGALEEGRVEECVDGRLLGDFPADEVVPVMKLGLVCTSQVPSSRPDMREVVNILELIRCPSDGQDESS
ncbi:putative LRR receptor-like serine/threonine-protein kinase IRK [Drosera capensis]